MSYRTIKRLLGETSLERKCRFLFGSGLMLLITGSFWFYARMTSTLVYDQNTMTSRLQIVPIILEHHWPYLSEADNQSGKQMIEDLSHAAKSEDFRDYSWLLMSPDPAADPKMRPLDQEGAEARQAILGGEKEVIHIDHDTGEYRYYSEIRAQQSCLACHNRDKAPEDQVKLDDLIGIVKITVPLEQTEKALAWNSAILLATAIVTAFLAMLAAYAIVRYVIVKPVLHLKDVSDEITQGNLELRADIRTGDEFEELSHAFNRMLRHLVTVQDELRDVNSDLDAKVDELAQVNLRLYEMNKLKDEFLATMSHELRTPLNSILGFSDVLADVDRLTEKEKRFVTNIQRSGRDLMSLINDLLDLAKIESGKMDIQPSDFSLHDLIERQINSFTAFADKRNIALTWQVDNDIPALWQDAGKLQQILNNLLSNAIKFTPEGGRVDVCASRYDEHFVDVTVEDSGVGIPTEDQETIFEKFRQGRTMPGQHSALTREYGGTGLGLSIVKELTKLLGGEVMLESEFGKGSTFCVRIPIRKEVLQESTDSGNRMSGIYSTMSSPTGQLTHTPSNQSDRSSDEPAA